VVRSARQACAHWRSVPAPKRGEIVRRIGLKLRNYKEDLGRLVSYEMGKSLQEGLGEVQEMIDVCDFAVGQSRMLYGFTMHSEREQHRMFEQYHLSVAKIQSHLLPGLTELVTTYFSGHPELTRYLSAFGNWHFGFSPKPVRFYC